MIYKRLAAEMAYRGITQQQLAENIGRRMPTVNGWLTGHVRIPLEEAIKIRKSMGTDVPLEELFNAETV